jgi:hypothetical protein
MFGVAFGTSASKRPASGAEGVVARFGFMLVAVGLQGCGDTLEFNSELASVKPASIAAEMELVAPMVTPELLNECKARLEAESFLGAKYKVVSAFTPNLRASCIVQQRGGLIPLQTNVRSVAFTAVLKKIAGAYGTGSPTKVGGCHFALVDNKVRFAGLVPEHVKILNECLRVSSTSRSTDTSQLQRT